MGLQLDRRACLLMVCALSVPVSAADLDLEGVQAAAIEMPYVAAMVRRPNPPTPADQLIPLNVLVEDVFEPGTFRNEYAFPAFVDTGTSGVLISREFYEFLGIQQELGSGGTPASFFDVTVNGEKEFHISEPLYLSIAPFPLNNEPEYDDLPALNQVFTAPTLIRAQLAIEEVDTSIPGSEPRNVMGMPALIGKAVLVDSTIYNHLDPESEELPYIQTTVHAPNDPALPVADYTIKLSYANFDQFTRVSPVEPGVEGPTLVHNPFIGPNPLAPVPQGEEAASQGVTVVRNGGVNAATTFSSSGSWLLDTGAQISFMSSEQAELLNITLDTLLGITVLTDSTTGELIESQFFVPISGADPGSIDVLPGFILDELRLPGEEGTLIFHDIPILIVDVVLEDALGNTFTLDGDIGMNLFLPSMGIEGDPAVSSHFDYMVFDELNAELRLTLATVPEPASLSIIALAGALVLRRRRA